MTTSCATCSSALDEGSRICPNCGTAVADRQPAIDQPDSIPVPSFTINEDLNGIGGWLILPAIRLVLAPFGLLYTILVSNVPFLFGGRHRAYLSSHPGSAALILFEFISNTILIAIVICLNLLFFKKKRAFPTYMILYMVTQLCVLLIDTLTAQFLHPTAHLAKAYGMLLGTVIASFIWIPYFLVSRRVKATFVN
jgi:hypothetical protein